MRGEVLSYDVGADSGLIRGEDGVHYRFRRADLIEFTPPPAKAQVEFAARGESAGDIAVLSAPTPEKLDIWGYFIKCMGKSFNATGRARRMEYWSFVLFSMMFVLGTSLFLRGVGVVGWFYAGEPFAASFAAAEPFIVLGVALFFTPAHICVTIRRLHDIGMTGWWVLLILFPVAWIFLVICELIPSARGPNKHGPYPKPIKQKA